MDLKTVLSNRKAMKKRHAKTTNTVKQLDENIYIMDYRSNYFLNDILETGVSSLGGLISFVVKKFNTDFEVGDYEGSGCTSFNAHNPAGDNLLCRNFDFRAAPCMVVWTHPENAYASIGVIDNNFMLYGRKYAKCKGNARALLAPYCCVDGINECGLAISVLQLKAKTTKQADPSKKDIVTTVMIRGVLDTCKDVDEAAEFIKSHNMIDMLGACYHYQIADKSGRSIIVEYINNELHIYEKGSEKYPVEGSVYEGDGLDFQYISNYTITKDIAGFEVVNHGTDRTAAVIKVMNEKNNTLTELEAMDLLSYVRLDYDHPKYPWWIIALWSAVYNTNEKTLTIAAGTDYSRVYTFSVDKPLRILEKNSINTVYPRGEWEY